MLTDEQKDAIGMALVPLYQQLERDVIADCARRLQKTGRLTETAEIMADALRAKGYSPTQIRREVMRAVNADASLQREIAENTRAHKQAVREAVKRLNAEAEAQSARLWEKAGNMAFRGDLSAWQGGAKPVKDSAFSDMIAAMKRAAAGELKNLTKSLGFRLMDGSLAGARSIYTAEMNRALVKLTSGAFSWRQCVRDACRELGRSGLRTVDYDSGAARSLDTAAFNALRTSSARLSAEITMHNVETTETALVEVSSHWGAREGEGHANHAGWQGKIYAVHGATDKYPNLEEATGYPSDPRGLCGYNCRHTFYPYWEGISEPADFPAEPAPVEVNGREYTYYQATQEQRRREREIRAMKREANALEAAGEGGAAKELRSAIRGKALEYRQFSDDVGIRAKVERLGVGEGTKDVVFEKKTGARLQKPENGDKLTSELGTFKKRLSSDQAIDKDYHQTLKRAFSHGSGAAQAVFNKYVPADSVAETDYLGTPYYDARANGDHRIHMNYAADMMNSRGNGVTFFHEHGHLIDQAAGTVSHDTEFFKLLNYDVAQYQKAYGKAHGLKTYDKVDAAISKELNSMRKHSAVSDLLGGITKGNITGIAGHSPEYWKDEDSITAEAFAHMFQAQFDPVRHAEMKRYFPRALDYFEKKLEEKTK